MTREQIVVGLDIGTTKVGTVIAAGDAEGALRIIGVGSTPSRGIKRGVVVDVEETVAAIQHSVERAAHMAGVRVEGVIVGVTGEHIESSNCHAAVTVAGSQGAITREDVSRVLQAAALEIPRDREILHSLPRFFSVDGHSGVRRPIGMTGQKLEVETHIVTGKAPFLQNAVQCVERAGLKVEALVLEPIATAEAVTTADEREMGVILIDIGGGTSDLAVFHDGSIVYSGVLPVGGNHVTRDIAIGLRTPFEVAENLKLESGAATREMIPHGEALEITLSGTTEQLRIPRAILGEIIEARMSELFELAREMMHSSGARKRLPGGVILSGGGALLPGAIELANSVFSMPVRLGYPQNVSGWSDQVSMPQLATGVGLCRFALTQQQSPSNQLILPPIAALEGRRVWGAIASEGEDGDSAPGFISGARPREAAKGAPLIDVVPNLMEASPLAPPPAPPPLSIAPAPAGNNAPKPPVTAAKPAKVTQTIVAPTATIVAEAPKVEAPNTEKPQADAPDPFADANPVTTPRSPDFDAPRFDARPTPTRLDARVETPRAEDPRSETARPSEAMGDGSYPRATTHLAAKQQSTDAAPSSGSGTTVRRAPVKPDGTARVRPNSRANGSDENGVFRRSDATPQGQPAHQSASAQETWWEKLKNFLGFERVDD